MGAKNPLDFINTAGLSEFGVQPGDMPIVGGMLGPSSEDLALQEAIKKAQEAQQAYRPWAAQAQQQAIGNITDLFGPYSQALQQMYGPQAGMQTSQLATNPISPGMLRATGATMPDQMRPKGPYASLTDSITPLKGSR